MPKTLALNANGRNGSKPLQLWTLMKESGGSECLKSENGSGCLWKKVVALKAYKWNGFEGLWLWMPMKMMTLNSNEGKGSKGWWLWMPMKMVTLNANVIKWWWLRLPMKENGSKGLWTPKTIEMALKACDSECLWKKWIWMPKTEEGGSECLTMNNDFGCQTVMMTLNVYERK